MSLMGILSSSAIDNLDISLISRLIVGKYDEYWEFGETLIINDIMSWH